MATETEHLCDVCTKPVQRKNAYGPWPKRHDGCKATRSTRSASTSRTAVTPDNDAADESAELDSLAVMDHFNLDYNLGNAVRWILDRDDAADVESLEQAQVYLERAIAKARKAA